MTEKRIIQTEGVLGGDPRIDGTRIEVHHVVDLIIHDKYTIGDIHYEIYPDLSEDDVHAALEYHFTHERAGRS